MAIDLRSRMVRLAGIEPATCGFEVRRSILLSYRRLWENSEPYLIRKPVPFPWLQGAIMPLSR